MENLSESFYQLTETKNMKINSLTKIIFLILIIFSFLQSCGRKGPLKLPEDVQIEKDAEEAKEATEMYK